MTNFNNLTTANRAMRIGSRQHHLAVANARSRQQSREVARQCKMTKRQIIGKLLLDITLIAAIIVSILASVGLLTTSAS